MFSGIGGFELGIQKAYQGLSGNGQADIRVSRRQEAIDGSGNDNPQDERSDGRSFNGSQAECVGFSEIDKYAIKVYLSHFPTHKNYGDARRIVPEELPDFDFLCGGFPCQAFSIAGKRGGFEDTRGTLFHEIARIAGVKRPKLLFLENVKGLLSHDKGRTFGTILSTFSGMGYFLEWQVLNSKNFGVPQNRERVFIIGHLGSPSGRAVFPITESTRQVIERIQSDVSGKGYASQQDRTYLTGGVMGCMPSTRTENKVNILVPVITPDRPNKRQNGRRMKEDGDPSFTVTAQDKHGIYNGTRIRRLTPTECERLQGFTDGWTSGVSDSQRYKCLGNAVTVNVIQAIVERLTPTPTTPGGEKR